MMRKMPETTADVVKHGIDKPSAELFKRAVKKMSVKPHDCIVIDDYKEFLDAVKKTGAKTILFK